MSVIRPLAALAAAATLSACATASRVGDAIWPFGDDKPKQSAESQDGRISILTFEQKLEADPALAGRAPNVPAPTAVAEWSQPGGDSANALGHIAGDGDLSVAWREGGAEGSSKKAHLVAPPVVSGGKLYLIDAGQNLIAYDAASGRKSWEKSLRPRGGDKLAVGGGVAVADGRIYATTGFGDVIGFDAASGDEVWRTRAASPYHAAPTAAGGRVFAVTTDSELIALDGATGQVLWTHQAIAEPARILAASSPAVQGDTVIAPFASGEVVALLAANGRRLWVDALTRAGRLTSLSAINDIAGRPAVADGVVYAVSHSGVLAAIDQRSGQRIWARGVSSTQTPWVAGDALYVLSVDGELAALDRANGAVFWVRQMERYKNEKKKKNRIAWQGPILVGGQLLVASSEGELAAVSPANGDVLKTIKLGQPVFVPPIAADGTVYVITDEGRLIALR